MSLVLVCWHSRKWQPPICGGLSQMLVLWLEKLNQIDSFCKKGILYAWGGKRSIERGKKHGNPPKITAFPRPLSHFLSLSWDGLAQIRTNWFCPEMGQPKSGQTEFGLKWASPNQDKLILTWNVAARGLKGLKQAGFLEVSPSLSSHFSCSRQCLCTWHGYFEKKSD